MSFTAVPSAGSKLRASTLSALISERTPVYARKTADQTVNNSTTLVNDTELFVAVVANAEYDVELVAFQNSGAVPGFKLNYTMPAGAAMITVGWFAFGSTAANEQFGVQTGASNSGVTGAAANSIVWNKLKLTTGANAGNLQFQWAQNTADVSNTIVRAGSTLTLRRVA